MTAEVSVSLGARSYPIVIGSGLLPSLGERVRERLAPKGGRPRAAVVTDSRVAEIYLETASASLRGAGYEVTEIQIPEGEPHKNLAWLALVYDRLVEAQLDRQSPVVALGGGVVGDLAGFAAATYLRGVPLVQVPTTLLAQVDASVGGKTAVNHAAGKNLIGAFHQPSLVLADVSTLETLSRREFVAGLAEVVKYGAILDPELFSKLESDPLQVLERNADALVEIVAICCRLKAMVVEEDEREGDYRAILNFGHTIGHAIETLTGYRKLLHGEAVAIGMVAAGRVSSHLGSLAKTEEKRIARLLRKLDLPTGIPSDLGRDEIAIAIEADKKAQGGKIRFVCLEAIGRTRFEALTAVEIAAAGCAR